MGKSRSTRRHAVLAACLGFLMLAGGVLLAAGGVQAQQSIGLSPDLIQQLQQFQQSPRGQSDQQTIPSQGQSPQESIMLPPAPQNSRLATSRLEKILSTRAGVELKQFGYEQLGVGRSVTVPQMGGVQDDYLLGPGDEVIVSIRGGQENSEFRAYVDRDGRVVLPRLKPLSASGRTLGEFRQQLNDEIHRTYAATEGFVSVGRLRQITVMVSGEVFNPGQRILTGLSSPVDALLLSGGVKKTGSLRNVRIVRGDKTVTIDLYSVLTPGGASRHVSLADGDRIIVPVLGPTVAVTGWVRRPGIYEIPPGQSGISVRNLLALSGGMEVRGQYRVSVLRIEADGRTEMTSVKDNAGTVRDSEILSVEPGADQVVGKAELSGGMSLAGSYSLGKMSKLSDMLRAPGALGRSPYTLFGIISRRDPRTFLRSLVAFTPVSVLDGSENMDLQSDDIVRVLSIEESRLIASTVKGFLDKRDADAEAIRNPQAENRTPQNRTNPAIANGQNPAFAVQPDQQNSPQTSSFNNQTYLDDQANGQQNNPNLPYQGQAPYNPYNQNDTKPRDSLNQGTPDADTDQSDQLAPDQNSSAAAALQASQRADRGGNMQRREIASLSGQYPPSPVNRRPAQPEAENLEKQALAAGEVPTNQEVRTFGALARQLGVDPLVLVNFMADHVVSLDGAVRGPGQYVVGPSVNLQDLVAAAGGTMRWADESGVELVSTHVDPGNGTAATQRDVLPLRQGTLASYIVKPADEFRFSEVFTNVDVGSVTLQGQVKSAGTYKIMRGDHLSTLLARAGGLTAEAYPYGTVFLRKSAAALERDSYARAAREIEEQITAGVGRTNPNERLSSDAMASMQVFVRELRDQKALGRISIIADPALLAAKPDRDPLLEAGDVVFIPQRPYTVSVLGQVLRSGSYPYRRNEPGRDYIAQAGGYTQFADDDLAFVILPDGSARTLSPSWLNFSNDDIPPGSAIVVPRDLAPLYVRDLIMDTTQIVSQLALTAASLAVLSQNR